MSSLRFWGWFARLAEDCLVRYAVARLTLLHSMWSLIHEQPHPDLVTWYLGRVPRGQEEICNPFRPTLGTSKPILLARASHKASPKSRNGEINSNLHSSWDIRLLYKWYKINNASQEKDCIYKYKKNPWHGEVLVDLNSYKVFHGKGGALNWKKVRRWWAEGIAGMEDS